MNKSPVFFLIQLLVLAISGCTRHGDAGSPEGYDLAKPVVYSMPSVLDEISGISFHNGNADTLYAQQDEEGKLFYFHPGDEAVNHTKFSKKGDYEDVAICNNYVVMLRSDGVLFTFPLSEIHTKETANVTEQNDLLPEGEYESMYADETNNRLYVLCKSCRDDKTDENISGHVLQVSADGKLSAVNNFSVDIKKIAALAGVKKIHFKPSALAYNRKINEWYIVSSVNKMLVTTNENWLPGHVYSLSPSLFTQPEGIAFDGQNNLYISNEIGNGQKGTVLQFLYQKK